MVEYCIFSRGFSDNSPTWKNQGGNELIYQTKMNQRKKKVEKIITDQKMEKLYMTSIIWKEGLDLDRTDLEPFIFN